MEPDRFDQRLLKAVGEVGRARLGELARPGLVRAIERVSAAYTTRRQVLDELRGDDAALAARLHFFLPRDLPKIDPVLDELGREGLLPSRRIWNVLDLGAGLGTTTLGVARFAARTGAADRLRVTAVDRDRRALELFADLAARASDMEMVPIDLQIHDGELTDLRPSRIEGGRDLVLAGLVLNEMTPPDGDREDDTRHARWLADVLTGWHGLLADDGALVVLEPALRDTARRLQAVRDHLAARGGPPHVVAPCVRPGPCPMLEQARHWCHADLPGALPGPVAELAREAGLRAERRTVSPLVLRRVSDRPIAFAKGSGGPYRVVSAPLRSKGKVERVLCGEPGLVRLMRLDRHAGPANDAVERARRGSLMAVAGEPRKGRLRLEPDVAVRSSEDGNAE